LVVGVGINVSNDLPIELSSRATRTFESAPETSVDDLTGPIISAVRLATVDVAPLTSLEMSAWRLRDVLAGQAITGPVAGVVQGITAEGGLLVKMPDGQLRTLRLGTVSTTA
jgi:biotin-(acetyl-CoA carboxylase) ligase